MIYTPGFVRNGREWRGWFNNPELPDNDNKVVGVLNATIDNDGGKVEFMPTESMQTPLLLNVAWLGFGLTTDITGGENNGKRLTHDFVVLEIHQYRQTNDQDGYRWQLPAIMTDIPTATNGIAIWITTPGDPTPMQATGGFLNVKKL